MTHATSDALQEPTQPVSLSFQILLSLATAGATITLLPVLIVLVPAQVTQIDPLHSANSLALVLALGAFAALIGNPLAGALSDRTTAHLGRRRPWLLTGALGVSLGLGLLASSASIPQLALGWFLVQFFGNVLLSSYGAILPDRVPVRQRGTTQAIIGLSSPLAIVLSDLLFTRIADPRGAYPILILVQLALTLLFVALYREARLAPGSQAPFRLKPFLASFWVSPRKFPDFARVWAVWFLLWLGYNLGTGSFLYLYVQHISGYESLFPGHLVKEGIATIQMVQIALSIPLTLGAGLLSDRSGRIKPFVMGGGLLIGAGLVGLVFFSSWAPVLLASVTIGAGFGIFYNLGLAMVSRLLPSSLDRGKYLGVINIASTLPQVIMPPIGALIVNAAGLGSPLGYQALFLLGAFAACSGALLIRSIRGV
jgi:MFS family permease